VGEVRGVAGFELDQVIHPRLHRPPDRGLHSFTSQLNLSAVYAIVGVRRDCVARDKEVLGGV